MSETPNYPDSSLPPVASGNGAAMLGDEGPGRTIDVEAESTETDTDALRAIASMLERAPVPARKKGVARVPPPKPQLPSECVGIACLIRTRLQQLAERCGQERKCWERALSTRPQTGGES